VEQVKRLLLTAAATIAKCLTGHLSVGEHLAQVEVQPRGERCIPLTGLLIYLFLSRLLQTRSSQFLARQINRFALLTRFTMQRIYQEFRGCGNHPQRESLFLACNI
jgi:hypothetical protein